MTYDFKRPFHSLSDKANDIIVSAILAVLLTGGTYLIGLAFGWIHTVNWLEAFAVLTSYSCTYLCVVQRRINYPIGAISTAAYALLFFQSGLLASMALNLYLTPTLIYGWLRWRKDEVARPVEHTKLRWVPVYLVIAGAAYIGATYLVGALGGKLAFFDVAILVGTVVAQLLMDNKKLENWIVWLAVDIVAIYVYFTSGLTLAGFQYVFFALNAVWGFYEWRKTMKVKTLLGVVSPAEAVPDMRTDAVDNPFDYREDGSIQKGDPSYEMMMDVINSGQAVMGNQREDGTWDIQKYDKNGKKVK